MPWSDQEEDSSSSDELSTSDTDAEADGKPCKSGASSSAKAKPSQGNFHKSRKQKIEYGACFLWPCKALSLWRSLSIEHMWIGHLFSSELFFLSPFFFFWVFRGAPTGEEATPRGGGGGWLEEGKGGREGVGFPYFIANQNSSFPSDYHLLPSKALNPNGMKTIHIWSWFS